MIVIHDNFVVVVGYNNLDRAFLLLWDRLGLDAWFHRAVDVLLDESSNIVARNLLALVIGELLIFDGLLDSECRPFVNLQVQVASVCAECLGVNSGEAKHTLMFLSKGLEDLSEFSALFWGFCEDIGEWKSSLDKGELWVT